MELKEYNRLKGKVDDLRAAADRAAGALEQQMDRLYREFECRSLEEAEELLDKLEQEEAVAKHRYEEELKAFQEQWGEKLGPAKC